jgi:hypothetical protein
VIATCNPGFADCDGNPANGCEVNLNADPTHCGSCTKSCSVANGTAACSNGACTIGTCATGFADCNGVYGDGCEINLLTDPTHCGTCTQSCSVANGTAACSNGTCAVGGCNAGWSNCNGLYSDGCEAHTDVDVNNCGACNKQCSVAHGTAGCSSGACTVTGCNAGWGDCNGIYSDGCEDNLLTDNGNCGSCGKSCATTCTGNVSTTACSSGSCSITGCNTGYSNVDGACSNGCECAMSNVAIVCQSPTQLGILSVGGGTNASANLVSSQEAWYAVTFTGNGNKSYHPHIKLTTNPNSEFSFDVYSNCSGGTLTCGEGGVSTGITDWETLYNANADPNSKTSGGVSNFNPIPPPGGTGTVYIRVYRKNGLPTDCASFVLSVSN